MIWTNAPHADWCGSASLLATLPDRRAGQSRGTSIVMMEAAEYGKGDHLTSQRCSMSPAGRTLVQALVGPGMIEVANVFGEHREQMAPAQNDDVIETLTTHAAEEALTGGIHIWRSNGGLNDLRPEGLGSAVEVGAELAVPVADDETRSVTEWRNIAELLRSPLLGGSPRCRDVHDFARAKIDDEEGEDGPEPNVVGL